MPITIDTMYGTFDETALNDIKCALEDINFNLDQIDKHNDTIKETIDSYYESYGIPKKILKKLAKSMHKSNFESESAEYREFESLFEVLKDFKIK